MQLLKNVLADCLAYVASFLSQVSGLLQANLQHDDHHLHNLNRCLLHLLVMFALPSKPPMCSLLLQRIIEDIFACF